MGQEVAGPTDKQRSHSGRPPQRWSILSLVASAGGIDAVSRVLAPLPADLAAAVLVLIHSDPDRINALPHILARTTSLPVGVAVDDEVICPGRVRVVPAGRHLLVTTELHTALIASGDYPPSRPSADLLLTSLALSAGSRAIAVVLSGGGHDGATGAAAVHRFGGTVLASDETSSSSFSMPLAAIMRESAVDEVIDLDALALRLISLTVSASG